MRDQRPRQRPGKGQGADKVYFCMISRSGYDAGPTEMEKCTFGFPPYGRGRFLERRIIVVESNVLRRHVEPCEAVSEKMMQSIQP